MIGQGACAEGNYSIFYPHRRQFRDGENSLQPIRHTLETTVFVFLSDWSTVGLRARFDETSAATTDRKESERLDRFGESANRRVWGPLTPTTTPPEVELSSSDFSLCGSCCMSSGAETVRGPSLVCWPAAESGQRQGEWQRLLAVWLQQRRRQLQVATGNWSIRLICYVISMDVCSGLMSLCPWWAHVNYPQIVNI